MYVCVYLLFGCFIAIAEAADDIIASCVSVLSSSTFHNHPNHPNNHNSPTSSISSTSTNIPPSTVSDRPNQAPHPSGNPSNSPSDSSPDPSRPAVARQIHALQQFHLKIKPNLNQLYLDWLEWGRRIDDIISLNTSKHDNMEETKLIKNSAIALAYSAGAVICLALSVCLSIYIYIYIYMIWMLSV